MKGYSIVASRYAGALLQLSNERQIAPQVAQDLSGLLRVWNESLEVRAFLKNPVLQPGLKIPFIEQAFSQSFQELTMRFLQKMVRARRAGLLAEVAEAFADKYRRQQHILVVEVKSAAPLSDSVRDRIKKWVSLQPEFTLWKSVELLESVDIELIGGLILRIEGQELDLSFDRKLEDFRAQFSKNLYVPDF